MPHVLVVGRIKQAGTDLLAARSDITLEVLPDPSEADLLARMPKTHGILLRTSRLTRAMIAAAPELKIVARHGVGYDNVDVAALTERRIPLAVAGTANTVSVAEHAFFMMIALAKQALEVDAAVRAERWAERDSFKAIELLGKTLLVLGFGRIGRELVRRALGFGMRIQVVDPFVTAAEIEAAGAAKQEDLMAALAIADFVSVHTPRSPETEAMIGEQALAAMKPEAILVNTARGGIVDEAALKAALDAGRIRAAGLDVLDQEPPPPGHPLLDHPRILWSPHIAGVTVESTERMATVSAENVLAAFDGHLDPSLVINPEVLPASARA